jgi:hypothetical protein
MTDKAAGERAMGTIHETPIRELDHRHEDGIDVTLLWNSKTNSVFLRVVDERLGETIEFGVVAEDALYAFQHPYAYASLDRNDSAIAA